MLSPKDPQQQKPSRICEKCGAQMDFLAKLPPRPQHGGEVNMFRCHVCDHVLSEPTS